MNSFLLGYLIGKENHASGISIQHTDGTEVFGMLLIVIILLFIFIRVKYFNCDNKNEDSDGKTNNTGAR